MPSALDIRLPGVYFLAPSQAASAGLPPLDVAAFVGFAERGPLHLPLAVEDVNTYKSIFGGDLPLAREVDSASDDSPLYSPPSYSQSPTQKQSGRMLYANLSSSVAAFFANGGRRCYIVRVAGKRSTSTRFRVPAIVALGVGGDVQLASVSASSPGRWSARLRLGTRLQATPLPVTTVPVPTFQVRDACHLIWQTGSAPHAIQPGDLLRLRFADDQQWLFPVTDVQRSVAVTSQVILEAKKSWGMVSGLAASITVQKTFRLTLEGVELFDTGGPQVISSDLRITLSGADQIQVRPGDVLLLELSDGYSYLFPAERVHPLRDSVSPPATLLEVQARAMLRLNPGSGPAGPPTKALTRVDRLRFDLLLHEGDLRRPTLGDLAFNSGHPRFWGEVDFLESSPLQRQTSSRASSPANPPPAKTAQPDLAPAALAARLFRDVQAGKRIEAARYESLDNMAWAALLAPVDEDTARTYLPLNMPWVQNDEDLIGPDAGRVGNDDLDTFEADAFLDEHIVQERWSGSPSIGALMATAADRYYVQDMSLIGMHSLMFVDEVALVCVPDAVHRGWKRRTGVEGSILSPSLAPKPALKPCPPVGPFADCLSPPTVSKVEPAIGPRRGGTQVMVTGTGFTAGNETTVTFDKSPARNSQVISDTSLSCITPAAVLSGPVTVEVVNANGSGSQLNAFTYAERSTEPALPDLACVKDFDIHPLLTIQQALIGLCQARADVVGILTLPVHFEKRQCIEWQETLRQNLGLPRRGTFFDNGRDIADLSYVAVYHPWLLVADPSSPDQLRPVPGDGAVCGMIATRERERRVWVAPANLPLQGGLGLVPTVSTEDWAELFNLQFNLIRPEPRDFRAMSAHTLSDERALLQLSVRRLMILLRKAVLARGMDFVFETNHERFREGVRVAFLNLLRFLFEGGAFSGPTPEAAFRVVTDASVNPPQSIEQGRFVAQIQVAPSQPTEFITVLLTRTGEGLLQATET
jgi:hypothetical protein